MAQRMRLKGSHANLIRDIAAIISERIAVKVFRAPSSEALVKALKTLEIKKKRQRAMSIFYRLRYHKNLTDIKPS